MANNNVINLNDIDDLTDPNSTIGFWNQENQLLSPYLYQNMLRPTPITGDTVTVYYGRNQLPTGLNATADDAKANFDNYNNTISRDHFHVVQFKKGRQMNTHYLNQISKLLRDNSNDPALTQSLAKLLFKDNTLLMQDGAHNREALFEQALNNGVVSVNDNGITDVQDMHFPANHHLAVDTKWGTTSSHAIKNLTDAMQYIEDDNNTTEVFAIMNQHTLNNLYDSGDVIHGMSLNRNDTNVPINPTGAKSLVQGDSGLIIKVYNKGYMTPNGLQRFIPDGRVILVPEQVIGRLVYAPTDEQQYLTNSNKARVSNPDNGLTLTTYSEVNPPGYRMIASQRILPVIDDIRNIITLDTNVSQNPKGNSYSVSPIQQNQPSSNPSSGPSNSSKGGPNSSSKGSNSKSSK